mgnify:CR=1 FL=1
MRFAELSSVAATWISVIAGIGGGYVALDNYLSDSRKQIDDRQKQVFDLARSYSGREMLAVRDKVLRFVMGQRTCSNETPQQLELSDTEMSAFVEYFDVVAACVEANLCDRALAERFFAQTANLHWPVLKAQILAVRQGRTALKNADPYGFGLESLAADPVPYEACK